MPNPPSADSIRLSEDDPLFGGGGPPGSQTLHQSHSAKNNGTGSSSNAEEPVYFSVGYNAEKNPTKLVLRLSENVGLTAPRELVDLSSAIESLGRDLSRIFNRKGRQEGTNLLLEFLAELKGIAEAGLASNPPQLEYAYSKLEDLKLDVLARELGPRRLEMTRRLAWMSAGLAVLGTFMFAAPSLPSLPVVPRAPELGVTTVVLRCLGLLLAGCGVGVWLASILRKPPTSYAELTSPERDIWGPTTKFSFSVILTLVLALMFDLGLVVVNLGLLNTTRVFISPPTALLIGILCGMGEQALSERIAPFAAKVVNGK